MTLNRIWLGLAAICGFFLTAIGGCLAHDDNDVIVYTAQDQEFAEPIFARFTERTGIAVRPKYDSESAKTFGLVSDLIEESKRPRADVFWNNEPLNTVRLEKLGLLAEYNSPAAADYPAEDRTPRGTWCGFAARARVLVVNTRLVPKSERPRSIEDLADPKWRGRVGMAKPLFGSTATHAAALFAVWGADKARDYYRRLKQNRILIEPGNKQVAVDVAAGKLAFGIADTDDALEEVEHGQPVEIIYPDQQPGGMGTFFFPNTLSIVRGAPHATAARKLVDYLLSPAVEAELAAGASAQIPLNANTKATVRIKTPREIRPLHVDFAAAADSWDAAAKFLRDEFTGGE